jgi:hypothetical protein
MVVRLNIWVNYPIKGLARGVAALPTESLEDQDVPAIRVLEDLNKEHNLPMVHSPIFTAHPPQGYPLKIMERMKRVLLPPLVMVQALTMQKLTGSTSISYLWISTKHS